MERRVPLLIAAASTVLVAGAGHDLIGTATRRGDGGKHRPTPVYRPRIGDTHADQNALMAASERRARRGAKRFAAAQAAAAGYYFAKGA